MSGKYIVLDRTSGHVLSSPTELREPETNRLACAIWSWVPDPEGRSGHHFASRSEAKARVRSLGKSVDKVTFRRAA